MIEDRPSDQAASPAAPFEPAAATLSRAAQRVAQALVAAGVVARVVELPASTRTAVDAASAVGCSVAQIVKSLVFRRADTDAPVMVLASGPTRVDEKKVSAHLGAALARAPADFVRTVTGYAIGGVPPLGHAQPIRTLIDRDLLALETVWAAAGTPNAVFSITPAELVRATGGELIAIH